MKKYRIIEHRFKNNSYQYSIQQRYLGLFWCQPEDYSLRETYAAGCVSFYVGYDTEQAARDAIAESIKKEQMLRNEKYTNRIINL